MTSAHEYRQYARECMDSARNAPSDPIRDQFLELAKLWLTATERMADAPPDLTEETGGDGGVDFKGAEWVWPTETDWQR